MPHPMHHPDYRRDISKPIHHSTSVTLYSWSRGIFGSAPSTDDRAIIHNATIKPACDAHKLQHQEAIQLVEQSTSTYLTKIKETVGFVTDIRCSRSELPFYVFNDIDTALFSGVLKGNVYLKWAPLPTALFGRTIRAGRSACPRIAIELADHVLARGAPEEILEVLVHQMIHAFLLQCCGHRNHDVSGNGHNLRHGLEFSTIAYIFQKHFFPKRDTFSPAEIGCIGDPAYHARSRHMRHTYLKDEAGSSFCCPNRTAISFSSAGKHYEYVKENTLAPKLDLPSQEPKDGKKPEKYPISQYVFLFDDNSEKALPHVRGSAKTAEPHIELHFKDHAYLMKRAKLSKFTTLSDRTTSDPVVKVPTNDEDTFNRLYDFINRGGDYKPAIKERQTQDPFSKPRFLGPPRIVDFEANGKAFLVVDIQMYRLGMAMDFPELKTRALARLRAQCFTNEDPCAVLEHIYHGGPAKAPNPKSTSDTEKKSDSRYSKDSPKKLEVKRPDDGIRQWVKDWLQVKSKSGKFSGNLEILQQHPLWTDKYKKLRERGSELVTDIDAVEAEIKKAKMEQLKSQVPKTRSPDRVLHIAEHLQKVFLETLFPGRPASVPPTHKPQFAIPADYDFPLIRYPYAPRRSQDDSEIISNSQSFYHEPQEREIWEAMLTNLAHAYPK